MGNEKPRAKSEEVLPLRGPRLLLRDPLLADLPAYREAQQPDREWRKTDGPYYAVPSPEETDRALEMIRGRIDRNEWPSPRVVLFVADAETNQLLGRVSRYWQSEETNWLSVGVVIFDPARWNGGLGHEALGLWSDYLFGAMPDLARLDLRTWSGHPGMMRLAEKLGYTLEARFRKARIVEGEHYDGLGYGVLREEWALRYPTGFSPGSDGL